MTTRHVSAKQASSIIGDLAARLERSEDLPDAYAEAILRQAQQTAGLRPTPQAPMAAAGMGVEDGIIQSLTGGAPSEVAMGSEFGSDIYGQFHKPHNSQGYWLLPSAHDPNAATIEAGEEALDQEIEAAIRGF